VKYKSSLLILVAQGKTEPWESIWREGQIPTWVNRYKDEVEIVNVSGISMGAFWKRYDALHERVRFSSKFGKWQGRFDYLLIPWLARNIPRSRELSSSEIREIQICTNSSYIFAGRRLLGAINWFLNETKFEYLFLTTTSSLINVNQLIWNIEKFDSEMPIYAGHLIGESPNQFVTGSGILMNRITACLIIDKFMDYPYEMLNDVALGTLLLKNGLKPLDIPWMWCKSVEEVLKVDDKTLSGIMHFRCKTDSNPRNDSEIMATIHQRLLLLRSNGLGNY
jgi:hypothetical protein